MTETLSFLAVSAPFAVGVVVHRAGLVFSLRAIGNWWYAMAEAVICFRREFARLQDLNREAQ